MLQVEGENAVVKTVAMTKNCILGVYGAHECVYTSGIPQSLANRLDALPSSDDITDIHITEGGEWVVLGSNIYWSDGVPRACIDTMNSMLDSGDHIICISFNDRGDWAVISDKHWKVSGSAIEVP